MKDDIFKKFPELYGIDLTSSVDQLNLARKLLADENRNLYPAAFILVDNVVESNLVHFLTQSGESRKAFQSKLNFAKENGFLIPEIAKSIEYLRRVRNCVQHERSLFVSAYEYKDVIHPLAIFYHEIACGILHRYAKIRDKSTDALQNPLEINLIDALVIAMCNMIASINESLNSLARLLTSGGTREDALLHARKEYLSGAHESEQLFAEDPIPKWNEKLCEFEKIKQPHAALKKFFKFAGETKLVRDSIRYDFCVQYRKQKINES